MHLKRRKFIETTASGVALLAAAGCDQLPRALQSLLPPQAGIGGPFRPPAADQIDPLVHVLNHATFGARPGDYERISKLAKEPRAAAMAFLEQQLAPATLEDRVAEYAARRFETMGEPLGELFEYQPKLLHEELMRATLMRAVLSERQLFEVMVQFWSDHFNIDPSKGECKWLKVADDRDVIRPHALGKFPEMLRASLLSPAMLWYLDGRVNRRRNSSEKPNENYARELLELHTVGVHGGYTQEDVMEVARCLTGWTVRSKENKPYFGIGKVEFKPDLHDFGAKRLLGYVLPAAPEGLNRELRENFATAQLTRVLEIVTTHPATATHIATKLCRHFMADAPPEGAVKAVAETFRHTAGDITPTLRTLFTTDEFWAARGNKFKRPFTFVASALRAVFAETDAGMPLVRYLERMGHAPFTYPTPDGFPDVAAPWLGTLLWRWNFAVAISENELKGTKVNLKTLRERVGGDEALACHLLGRRPTGEEMQAYHESGLGVALLLASPAFQMC
jgi:uncharacterized protein (DUF1800 family)